MGFLRQLISLVLIFSFVETNVAMAVRTQGSGSSSGSGEVDQGGASRLRSTPLPRAQNEPGAGGVASFDTLTSVASSVTSQRGGVHLDPVPGGGSSPDETTSLLTSTGSSGQGNSPPSGELAYRQGFEQQGGGGVWGGLLAGDEEESLLGPNSRKSGSPTSSQGSSPSTPPGSGGRGGASPNGVQNYGSVQDPERGVVLLTPRRVKAAYRGDAAALAQVEAWMEGHAFPESGPVLEFIRMFAPKAQGTQGGSQLPAEFSTPKLQEMTAPMCAGLPQQMGLPAGYEDPKLRGKIMRMLSYLHNQTFEDRLTWKQIVAMVGALGLAGWSVYPNVPVITVGFTDIYIKRLGDTQFYNSRTQQVLLISYVGACAAADVGARLPFLAKRFTAPSTGEFSLPPILSKPRLYGLLLLGGLVTGVIQLFYLVDAEKTFIDDAESMGESPDMFKRFLRTYSVPFFIEGCIWGIDQTHDFVERFQRKFYGEPRSFFSDELIQFRKKQSENFSALKGACYWLPQGVVHTLYDNLYNPEVLENMKAQNPGASQLELEGVLTVLRLQYLMGVAEDLNLDPEQEARALYTKLANIISTAAPVAASVYRYLALQIVFTLMIKEFSFGHVSEHTAERAAWVAAAFGSLPQGLVEVVGNLSFFHDFLPYWGEEPHGDAAMPGWRIPAQVYAAAYTLFWALLPLTGLCLDTTDRFFDGNMYWMVLAAPFLFSEFTGGAITLMESYVKQIPTTANRVFNGIRRKRGYPNTVGFMRDELVDMIDRLEKVFKGLDGEALNFLRLKTSEEN